MQGALGESIPPLRPFARRARDASSWRKESSAHRPGSLLAARLGSQLQLVVTIDVINRDKNTISLKGPDGVVETVNVANPANLDQVNVGDETVLTLTNVVALSLEKKSGR